MPSIGDFSNPFYPVFFQLLIKNFPGHVARMGEKRNAYRILVGKPE
jgi:hypothetical protein